jgi:hypothetical protein
MFVPDRVRRRRFALRGRRGLGLVSVVPGLVTRLCFMSQSDETSSLAGNEQGPSSRGRLSSSDSDKPTSQPRVPKAGLCETCAHRRLVPNTRGSVFLLCMLSRTDPRYPRYPRLPVSSCAGYERLAR